jgi:hypothetical protein
LTAPAILLVLLLCVALVGLRRRDAWRNTDAPWPFYAKRVLPSPAQVLHLRLLSALPAHMVLSGVDLASVLGVRRGFDAKLWSRRLRHLQYDFVVCAKDASLLAAITLEDPARSPSGKHLDDILVRASAAADLRLIRWNARALPDLAAIRAAFADLQIPSFDEVAHSGHGSWWPTLAKDPARTD